MCSITRSPFESVSSSISSILVVVLSWSGVLFLLFVPSFSSFISICCFRLQISAFRVSFSWLSSLFSVFMVSVSSLSSLMVCSLSSNWAFMFSIVVFRSSSLNWFLRSLSVVPAFLMVSFRCLFSFFVSWSSFLCLVHATHFFPVFFVSFVLVVLMGLVVVFVLFSL